jgi:hypothetical protein
MLYEPENVPELVKLLQQLGVEDLGTRVYVHVENGKVFVTSQAKES